ncbi:mucin-5AC [Zeugodacus cucurbitae]|uniref:Chitin-binding type-2 domain-containing protein n=1 Tax=Zeugodacus cucurbitae TaxID=28588 RepID=A0A0A1WW32_ZEUCU|nr:mucin-5AC [Zeugodacus cucurbitae]
MFNKLLKRFLIVALPNLLFITNEHFGHAALTGQCNICFQSDIACLDEQNFAACVDEAPLNVRTPCPPNTVCTADKGICQATARGAVPVCYEDQCGTCASAQKNFACLDETIYAICYDGQTPEPSSIESCSVGYVCDLKNPKICSPALTAIPSCTIRSTTDTTTITTTDTTTDTAIVTTTDTTADTTTDTTTITYTTTDSTTEDPTYTTTDTTSKTDTTTNATPIPTTTTVTITDTTTFRTTGSTRPPRDATTFCAETAKQGRFRQDGDTTCAKFIYCYRLAGQYLGRKYVCQYYFNAVTQECQTQRPDDC